MEHSWTLDQMNKQAKGIQLQINARFKNPILIGIQKPYNKMRIPFLEQRRGIQRKTKALIDGTFLKICVHVYVCRQRK